jgi:TolA-binding protein
MKTSLFASFCLSLTTASVLFYGGAREYFNRPDQYLYQIDVLKKNLQREQYKHFLTQYEFEEFRAHVATLLPAAIKEKNSQEKSYPLRSLASVVQKSSGDNVRIVRAKAIFEQGKKEYFNKNYSAASALFKEILRNHNYSVHVPEAMFLLVQCHFQLREHDAVIELVNKMIDVYPEDELTGYAILRLAQIYRLRDRPGDAVGLYELVLKAFPYPDLTKMARLELRATEL